MLDDFIYNAEWISFPRFPGVVIKYNFEIDNYNDNFFHSLDIFWHETLNSSVIKRRAEYLAGRYAAMQCFNLFGIYNFQLLPNVDRSAKWPSNILGSLSHSHDTVLCTIVSNAMSDGIGIDIEPIVSQLQLENIWRIIASPVEYDFFKANTPSIYWGVTLAFSAKESLYKAIYPIVRRQIDFLDVRFFAIDLELKTFKLELLIDLSEKIKKGNVFFGHFRLHGASIITFINLTDFTNEIISES